MKLRAAAAALLLVAGTSSVFASSCEPMADLRQGSAQDDQIHAAVRAADGSVYLGGFERGILNVENWPVGNARGFVEHRSASGALLWRHVVDTPGTDLVEALAVDAAGRVVVAGRTSAALPGQQNGGQFDLFIVVLSSDGIPVASGQFGDERPQHPVSVVPLSGGDFVVAGFDDTYVVGNAVLDFENESVARFAITQSSISRVWQQRSSKRATDLAIAAARASDGDDVFLAEYEATARAPAGNVRVRRIDANGAEIWSAAVSNSGLDHPGAIAVTPGGRLYVAGTTVNALEGPPLGGSDAFIEERDPATGVRIWGRQFGSAVGDYIGSLAVGADGALYAGGLTLVPGPQAPLIRPFATKLSQWGQVLEAWTADASYADLEDPGAVLIVPDQCGRGASLAGAIRGAAPGTTDLGGWDSAVVATGLGDRIFGDSFEAGQ